MRVALAQTQKNTAQRQRLCSRNIAGDHTPASHSLLFTEPQTFPHKLSQPLPQTPWPPPGSSIPSLLASPPLHTPKPGASQRPNNNNNKKGKQSTQKNSPDPPINTHTKEQACGKRKLPPVSTPGRRRLGVPSLFSLPRPGDDNPSPGQVVAPLPCSQHPSSFPTLGPLRKTPGSRCHRFPQEQEVRAHKRPGFP